VSQPAEAATPPLPAWRLELNEKVRAIKATRGVSSSTHPETVGEHRQTDFDAETRISGTSARQGDSQISYRRDVSFRAPATRPESNPQLGSPTTPGRRSSSNIVEAALTRVKRASENASRAALPKIEPARSVQATTQVSLAVDRQATARALDPAPEIESRSDFAPAPRPEVVQSATVKAPRVETSFRENFRENFCEKRSVEPAVIRSSTESQTAIIDDLAEPAPIVVLDEIGPLDYLEAEVRKVDKALGAEFLRNESPSIFTHLVIGVFDLLAVAVSCSLFLAIIRIADGSFSTTQTRLASSAIVLFITFFYLALTQCLCGRTFGMMLTNTRVVDALAFDAPSPTQSLLRTAGYFVAAAPAMLGIFWAAFNRRHRGWQDFLSGTVVVRDF
jgi:uncharacterized RDD family membrane protein YckC